MPNFQRPVDGALFLYRQGFKVFPLVPNSKIPVAKGWQEWADTASESKIQDFGKANPMHNWGIHCRGLLVIDLDKKDKAKNGFESLKKLLADKSQRLTETFSVTTPTGGKHLYYRSSQGKNTVGALGPGIDTRAEGGYVVAPGSRIDNDAYTGDSELSIADAPTWVCAEFGVRKPAETVADTVVEGERNKTLASLAGTMRARGMNYESIFAALLTFNQTQVQPSLPESEVDTIARSVAGYAPKDAKAAADFLEPAKKRKSKLAGDIDFSKIPKRKWIMEERYIGGFISALVSPGGIGKSTLSMLDAVAIASGKPLSGFAIIDPGAVWIYNTEDPGEEIERRLAAIAIHHGVTKEELMKVHYSSGREESFIVAKSSRDGVVLNMELLQNVIDHINAHKIKLLLLDPFVRTHDVDENSNAQMDKVLWAFGLISGKTGCAIGVVHHTRKLGANDKVNHAEESRGASAFINAARIAHTLYGMTDDEATEFGVTEERRGWYMRLGSAKANLHAPAESATWYERISITLDNMDSVGTVAVADIQSAAKAMKATALAGEGHDTGEALSKVMLPGEKLTVKDAVDRISTDPEYQHLFAGVSSAKGVPRLIRLLRQGIVKDRYWFLYEPEVTKTGTIKHWIVCSDTAPVPKAPATPVPVATVAAEDFLS